MTVRSIFLYFMVILFSYSNPAEAVHHDPFIITAIPKAGTHLLTDCIQLLTGKGTIGLIGGSADDFARSLTLAEEGQGILKVHNYSGDFASTLGQHGYKNLFICRDPRDACTSLVFYLDGMTGTQRDFYVVSEDWDTLTFDEKLMTVITGNRCPSYLSTWYENVMPWADYPDTLVVKFEALIGSKGGGNDDVQLGTLIDIALFLHMEVGYATIYDTAKRLYSPKSKPKPEVAPDFIPGQIGNWKYFFKEEHKQAFKRSYNHLLTHFGYERNDRW